MDKNEIFYYDEIVDFIKEQIESNFRTTNSELKVYCKKGELRRGLREIVNDNSITTSSIINFVESTPPLSLDVFALITDGIKFELLIVEVKLVRAMGLSELSQLIGYCIVSNAQYGLLVNVNGGLSPRLLNLITNEADVTHILRQSGNGDTIETKLGVMEWDSVTRNIEYTGKGALPTIPVLCRSIERRFVY